jgi:hypothetical protein
VLQAGQAKVKVSGGIFKPLRLNRGRFSFELNGLEIQTTSHFLTAALAQHEAESIRRRSMI